MENFVLEDFKGKMRYQEERNERVFAELKRINTLVDRSEGIAPDGVYQHLRKAVIKLGEGMIEFNRARQILEDDKDPEEAEEDSEIVDEVYGNEE